MEKSGTIVLVYAGGTIGMKERNGALAPPHNARSFENRCRPVTRQFSEHTGVTVEFVHFDKKDSSERISQDWTDIAKIIRSVEDQCGAVVVLHGTDTMHYSAAAVSLSFTDPEHPDISSQHVPIVFTGSQQPIYMVGGDGSFNLYHALDTAYIMMRRRIRRTVISFWNEVFLGIRTVKHSDKDYPAFNSPAVPAVGQISSRGTVLSGFLGSFKEDRGIFSPLFRETITAPVTLSPLTRKGEIYEKCDPEAPSIVIVKTLGAGNVPERFISEIERANREGHIIILCSPFAAGSPQGQREDGEEDSAPYILGKRAIEAGAIPAGDMVASTLDVKCAWLLGNNITSREEFAPMLGKAHAEEVTELPVPASKTTVVQVRVPASVEGGNVINPQMQSLKSKLRRRGIRVEEKCGFLTAVIPDKCYTPITDLIKTAGAQIVSEEKLSTQLARVNSENEL